MPRLIVLHWEPESLQVAVVRPSASRAEIVATMSLPWNGNEDETAGQKLAEFLERHAPSRTPAIAVIGRRLLNWQHLLLPPCPEEDLPDLVRLQSDYNHAPGEDHAGLDFLPLAGDEQTPHRVWAISINPTQLVRFRRVAKAADLKLEHLVPLALGWPAWTRHAATGSGEPATVLVAPLGDEPTIWATVEERVVLFRQLHLPAEAESLAPAIANELRRTFLAFAQEQPQAGEPLVQLVGNQAGDLAQLATVLEDKLQRRVEVIQSDASAEVPLPAMGLALNEAAGDAPLADLLHPHSRPAPRTSRRTYVLAAAAAASLAALIGWQAYAALQAPLDAVAAAQAEVRVIEQSSDALREYEQRAASVRSWLGNSVNLLDELQVLSTHVRPEPLKSESFPADSDVVIGKVVLQNKQFTIDAMAKENRAVQPLENRLRDGVHRVQRGKTEPSEAVPGYPLAFQSIVEVTDAAAVEETAEP